MIGTKKIVWWRMNSYGRKKKVDKTKDGKATQEAREKNQRKPRKVRGRTK